ncbi:MAG: cytidylate kinase-like family protein [Cyclobacteriaceae bacterium]|nr:cytidylate kinase-like family protein [Cyclobacteriaceae bacterium]
MERKSPHTDIQHYGPVITISRQYGCPAKIIAQDLSIKLNNILFRANKKQQWRWISKEILEESARELKMNKHLVQDVVNAGERGVMDDLIWSLSKKYYPGDVKVKKTLADVIREFASQGRVIIVGRAGVSLTRDVKDSLHIRLAAPFEWRVQTVSKRYALSYHEALKKIKEIDSKRDHLHEFFLGKKLDDSIFDIVFNYQTMAEQEILASIISVMEMRNII